MQAAFKFIVKPPKPNCQDDYLQSLADPAHIVDWQDVVELVYTPPSVSSPQRVVCPICLESVD